MASDKRQTGRYYTSENPFQHPAFTMWAARSKLKDRIVLEPFAGANSLIEHLDDIGFGGDSVSYDIVPAHPDVSHRDTLASFPEGYEVCVTNPPWLAKNSATVRGLPFFAGRHDDLYKYALEQCVTHCDWVTALVPESFIRANLFRDRLVGFVSLRNGLFKETGHPVGMALFQPEPVEDTEVWTGHEYIGLLKELESYRPHPIPHGPRVSFNEPDGNVGLIALDNVYEASIRFCESEELADYTVKTTGRHITKLQVDGRVRILAWNRYLERFRQQTRDVLMTCYKGIRRDGMYRRRMDWQLARGIIHHA